MTDYGECEAMDWIDWDEGRDLDDETGYEPGEPDEGYEDGDAA
jgi:hypothetical protein